MDLTKGCHIKFTESVFVGKYPKAKWSHTRKIEALIIKESYGVKKGQHTFTLKVIACDDNKIDIGSKILRKGRNVYPTCILLSKPDNHEEFADDKHARKRASIKLNNLY